MRYNKETTKPDGRILRGGGPRDLQKHQKQPLDDQAVVIDELRKQLNELTSVLSQKPVVTAEDFDAELRQSVEQAIKDTEGKFKDEVSKLKRSLEEAKAINDDSMFTPEQVDNEINKAIDEALVATKTKYEESISKLTNLLSNKDDEYRELNTNYEKVIINSDNKLERLTDKIDSLKTQLTDKEKVIETLEKNAVAALDLDDEKIAKLIADRVGKFKIDGDTGQIVDPNRPQPDVEFIDPTSTDAGKNYESHIEVEEEEVKKENLSFKTEKLKTLMNGKLPHRKI